MFFHLPLALCPAFQAIGCCLKSGRMSVDDEVAGEGIGGAGGAGRSPEKLVPNIEQVLGSYLVE